MRPDEALAREGELLLAAVRRAPDAPVPSCPGWDTPTLLRHVARVHRWAAGHLRDARLGHACLPSGLPKPGPDDDLQEWYATGLAWLVDEVRAADPARPAWTFRPADPTCGFWIRRQVSETLVHRIDAELAAGAPQPVDPTLAADALAELFDVLAEGILASGPGVAPAVVEVAGVGRWALAGTTVIPSDEPPTVVISGTAEEMLRAAYGRSSWDDVPATGDRRWLDDLQTALTF